MDTVATTQYNRLITLKESSFKQTLDLPAPTTTTKSSGTETKTRNAPNLKVYVRGANLRPLDKV
jgi:hypothetical protein